MTYRYRVGKRVRLRKAKVEAHNVVLALVRYLGENHATDGIVSIEEVG